MTLSFLTMAGRLSRFGYFKQTLLTSVLIYGAMAGFAWFLMMGQATSIAANGLLGLVGIASVYGGAITVRRLHDLGRPGWHFWLQMVPLYNIYIAFLLFFKAGAPGPNEHGENPLLLAEMAAMDNATDAFVDEDFDADTDFVTNDEFDDFDATEVDADPGFDTSEVFEEGQAEAIAFGSDAAEQNAADPSEFSNDEFAAVEPQLEAVDDGFEADSLEADGIYAAQGEEEQLFDEEPLRADFNATPEELEAYSVNTKDEAFEFAQDDDLDPDLDPKAF